MKIAILSRYQNSTYRGVESVIYELAKRLGELHQVDVLSGQDSDSFKKIINGHYDIVMPLNGRMQSLKASVGRLLGGYKLVIGGHSGIGRDDIWNIAIAKPDVFVALTKKMEDWAKKWAWGSKVIKIPNGIDLNKFTPEGKKLDHGFGGKVVLSVGALVPYKHHEKLIKALKYLPDISLLIIGKGEEKQRLQILGEQTLGDRRFKILELEYSKMPEVYRSVDVFSLPSWDREAFGVVYLEAMATNIPVVAPNDLSRKEIIGQGGILTDVDNGKMYADAINKALIKKWGNLPREQAEKFSWDIVVKEYLKCFESLS